MSTGRITVLVGLGANLGEPEAQLRRALRDVRALAADPSEVRASSLWASAPVDCPPGSPDFVNAVVALPVPADTDPLAFLGVLLELEAEAGRRRTVPNAPRTLDLDLLLFGDRELSVPDLVVPHPRGHERAFVLVPAAEVAPELPWPGTGQSVGELAATVSDRWALRRLP